MHNIKPYTKIVYYVNYYYESLFGKILSYAPVMYMLTNERQ